MKLSEIKQRTVSQEDILRSIVKGRITLNASKMHYVDTNLNLNGLQMLSLEGCPSTIPGKFSCWNNKLTSLEGCPKVVGAFRAGGLPKVTSLKGCPELVKTNFFMNECGLKSLTGQIMSVDQSMDMAQNKITNLHDIHKFIMRIGGSLSLLENPLKSHVLGLLKIKDLQKVFMDNHDVQGIIRKYLPEGDLLDCQEELIEAGFEEYAQL